MCVCWLGVWVWNIHFIIKTQVTHESIERQSVRFQIKRLVVRISLGDDFTKVYEHIWIQIYFKSKKIKNSSESMSGFFGSVKYVRFCDFQNLEVLAHFSHCQQVFNVVWLIEYENLIFYLHFTTKISVITLNQQL